MQNDRVVHFLVRAWSRIGCVDLPPKDNASTDWNKVDCQKCRKKRKLFENLSMATQATSIQIPKSSANLPVRENRLSKYLGKLSLID